MQTHSLPTGSIPALVTPMPNDGAIDWAAFRALIDWNVGSGSNAIVVAGSTDETATLTMEEHKRLIAEAVTHAAGRIPIIAGTGANATWEAIELTRAAAEAGAGAALSLVPYYNKPTQHGVFAHFEAIADASNLPVILYNVPGRTITDLDDDILLRLAELPAIAGLKDATGDIGRGITLLRALPDDFALHSGDDPTAAALMLLGARGNISVTANAIPAIMSRLCTAAISGDVETVRSLSQRVAPLHTAMFVESNPIPVKFALAQLGKIADNCRLPLTPLSTALRPAVLQALIGATDG